ncbi:MAG: FAD-binding protein [candidate division NC10 bacterium]|nr:FAD-binding protein [candidate division NC10 bacterium]
MERQRKAQLAAALMAVVGQDGVITDEDELRVYECDGLTIFKALPELVVLPRTREQVEAVARLCHRERVPFVARGAGTGLSGGALALEGGVMVGLNRMSHILEVDVPNQRAVVQPGMVNVWLSNKIAGDNFYYAPDPASQTACSIGGNIAENSGGVHTPKYGVTVNHVVGLEVVLPDGEVVEFGGKALDPPGYDLTGVFVGSEGTFGICTKITVRILRKPEAVKTLMGVFESIEDASNTVSDIVAAGILPACVEMMDTLSIQAVEKGVRAGYPTDAGSVLLVELDGPRAEVEALVDPVSRLMKQNKVREIRIAKDDAERLLLWKGRKAAFAAMGQISPDYYVQDAVIPRTKLPQILREIGAFSDEYKLRVANVFHAGDGNLHPLILYDGRNEGELHKAEEMGAKIMRRCIELGGSITGEHGVGREKRDYMPLMYTPADLEAMLKVKRVFNPDGLLNPGKIFPTTKGCVEAGAVGRDGLRYRPHRLEVMGLAQRF